MLSGKMKNKLLKHIFKKIKDNNKRFLSLFCMAFLGVGFFAGIQSCGPDMLKTLDNYYDENNVYDIEVISNLGLTNKDIEILKKIENVKQVIGTYAKDTYLKIDNREFVLRLIGLNDNINTVYLEEGKFPSNNSEIVVDRLVLDENDLKINDTITIMNEKKKIVGTVLSPLYFSTEKPTTTLGNGKVNYYAYVNEEVIKEEAFTNVYITVKQAKEMLTNSDEYLDTVNNVMNYIEDIKDERQDARYNELYGEKILEAKQYGIQIYESNFIKPKWYIFDRSDNDSYNELINASDNLNKLGDVFPIIFFCVAILVSLISMMRMIEEDRTENGTLKSLGFNNFHITSKYIVFSLLATITGGIMGILIGSVLIPYVIWNIYKKLFLIPKFIYEANNLFNFIGLLICVFCICGTAIFVCIKNLKNVPANLMRPKSPKSGKKILLENIPFIWKRLNFSNKITVRNIFRYKSRVITTILGIAGCTALILAGFGLKDSIKDVTNYQFGHILNYEKIVMLKENTNYEKIKQEIKNDTSVRKIVETNINNITVEYKDNTQEVTMIVANNNEELKEVITLDSVKDKNNTNLIPSDNSVIISEKTATLLNIDVGDKLIMFNDENNKYELKVEHVIKNFINQYLYINKNTYENTFKNYKINSFLIDLDNLDKNDSNKFDEKYIGKNEVTSIVNNEDIKENINSMLSSIDSIVAILIIAAALLAFVVLYNLSNINISERKREIATLKVLGFYNKEVDRYITRENILLTIIGIVIGLFFGSYLSHFIISTCEPNYIMFIRHVDILSYIISALMTILFTVIINIITHYNLKKIDMIESLKNVE